MVNHNGNYIISHFFLHFLFDWLNYDFNEEIQNKKMIELVKADFCSMNILKFLEHIAKGIGGWIKIIASLKYFI